MDLIERQKAIDAVFKDDRNTTIKQRLEALPTIEPERKKGKWINIRHDNIAECDQCGTTGRAWMNFCPICGADMREEDA